MQPSYYAIIPANVRYDERLKPNEKLMYGEITCLTKSNGVCFASNDYFSRLYHKTNQTITVWVTDLKKYGYIHVHNIRKGLQISRRCISIQPISTDTIKNDLHKVLRKKRIGYEEKNEEGIKKNLKDNNTSSNNIKSNISNQKKSESISDKQKVVLDLQKLMVNINEFVMQEIDDWFRTYNIKLILKAIHMVGTRNPSPRYVVNDIYNVLRNGCKVNQSNAHHSYRPTAKTTEKMPEWSKKDNQSVKKTDPKLQAKIKKRLKDLGEIK